MTTELLQCRTGALNRRDAVVFSTLLARAFFHDPIHVWLFPNPANRLRRLQAFFDRDLRYQLGSTHAVFETEHRGVAFWHSPGSWPPSLRALGVTPALVSLAVPRAWRALRLLRELDARHPSDRHWYLSHLAVSPSVRHLGIGSRIVGAGFAWADWDGAGCYLQTANRRLPWCRSPGRRRSKPCGALRRRRGTRSSGRVRPSTGRLRA